MCRPAWSRALADAHRPRDPVDREDAEALGVEAPTRVGTAGPGVEHAGQERPVPAGA